MTHSTKLSDVTIPSVSADALEDLTALLKASSDNLRLQILRILQQDSFGVLELCEILDVKQSGMSHHLKQLALVGMVSSRREGNFIFYRRHMLQQGHCNDVLRQAIFNAVDEILLDESILQRYSQIQKQRTQSSQDFFSRNSDKFLAQQDLIAEFSQYGDSVAEVIRNMNIDPKELAIEIGPGGGEFLPVLSEHFAQVIAIDNSASMLEHSKNKAKDSQLDNIQFILNRVEDMPASKHASCVISNMVLHHIPGPAKFFSATAGLLKRAGVLIITDLCQHDQNWARESCGDLWLGFDNKDIIYWAKQAKLKHEDSLFLAMRNGFQIQICSFIKH